MVSTAIRSGLDEERLAHARTEQLETLNGLVGEDEANVLRAVHLAPARHRRRAHAMFEEAARHRLAIDAEIGHAQQERPAAIRRTEWKALELVHDGVAPRPKLCNVSAHRTVGIIQRRRDRV